MPRMTLEKENTNCLEGWRCPECGRTDCFKVDVVRNLTVWLYDEGTDDKGADTEWNNDSGVECGWCHHEAVVFDFTCDDEKRRKEFHKLVEKRDAKRKDLIIDAASFKVANNKLSQAAVTDQAEILRWLHTKKSRAVMLAETFTELEELNEQVNRFTSE